MAKGRATTVINNERTKKEAAEKAEKEAIARAEEMERERKRIEKQQKIDEMVRQLDMEEDLRREEAKRRQEIAEIRKWEEQAKQEEEVAKDRKRWEQWKRDNPEWVEARDAWYAHQRDLDEADMAAVKLERVRTEAKAKRAAEQEREENIQRIQNRKLPFRFDGTPHVQTESRKVYEFLEQVKNIYPSDLPQAAANMACLRNRLNGEDDW
jgi:hypothetical protein